MDYRRRIIEEAARMFDTYGIRAVTMDMLASRLNISKRTIYEVFRDKDEVISGVVDWMVTMQKNRISEILDESGNVIEAIFRIINIMMEYIRKVSPAFLMDLKRVHAEARKKASGEEIMPYMHDSREILKKGISQGFFREDINVELTNRCLAEIVKMTVDKEVFPPDHFHGNDVIRNFYISYLRGISTSRGIELINKYEKGI